MTTNEIIEKLRDMPVDKMGPAEGVIVSCAVWEYNILSSDNAQKEELGKLIVSKAEQMKEAEATVDGFEYPSAQNLLYTAFTITGDEEYKNIILAERNTIMPLLSDLPLLRNRTGMKCRRRCSCSHLLMR